MNNMQKINLLGLRLRVLGKEADTLDHLEARAVRLKLKAENHKTVFDSARQLLDRAFAAHTEELIARSGPNSGKALSALRKSQPALYGKYRVANVDIEEIRGAIDKVEDLVFPKRLDGVVVFNELVEKWSSRMRFLKADLVRRSGSLRGAYSIRLGRYSFIEGPVDDDQSLRERDLVTFHRTVLRHLRRIAQTEVGQDLLSQLDTAARRFRSRSWSLDDNVLSIRLDNTGRIRVLGFPVERDSIQPAPFHRSKVPIPLHVTLYRELRRALQVLNGKDKMLTEKKLRDAENEYAKEAGFPFKRLNQGQAVRIDD